MQTTGRTVIQSSSQTSVADPAPRLAELVVHLTDCNPRLAVAAVNAATGAAVPAASDERLAIVAQAIISVRRQIDLRDPASRRQTAKA